MSHIRTISSAKLSEADKEKEISRIKRENSNIFQNLQTLEGEERAVVNTKSQQIQQLARNYERMHDLGEYTEPIDHICSTIVRLCVEKKLYASGQLARMALPERYKQTQFTSHNNSYQQQQQATETAVANPPNVDPRDTNAIFDQSMQKQDIDNQHYMVDYRLADILNNSAGMPPDASVFVDPTSNHLIVDTDKSPTEMTRDELRHYTEAKITQTRKVREQLLENRRREREALEECDKRKIALTPGFEGLLSQDHISAKSPDSGPSAAWESCVKLIKSYEKLADKLYRWRPPKQIQQDLVDAFEADIEFLEPFLDEKYRKCQPAWWVVQLNNIWHGKHAAAIMNSTPIDEKSRRALTREQVGDRYEEDVKRAIRFSAAIKKWASLWKWFVQMNEKGIATRAKELGPTLSDKAFS